MNTLRDEGYGSAYRERMKIVMEYPAGHRSKKIRRMCWNLMDALKDLLHMIGAMFGLALCWLALNGVEGFFR